MKHVTPVHKIIDHPIDGPIPDWSHVVVYERVIVRDGLRVEVLRCPLTGRLTIEEAESLFPELTL